MDQPAQIINEPAPVPEATNFQPPMPIQKSSKLSLILLVILVGVVGVAAFWLGKSSNGPKVATPTPTAVPIISEPTEISDSTQGWKTYTNNAFGYEIKYPIDWQITAPSGEISGSGCLENPGDVPIIEFSKTKLTGCGFLAEQLPPQEAEITIWANNQEWEKLNLFVDQPYEEIVLAGEKAVKYPFTEKSELPNIQATRIYFNHKGRGYLMFIKQIDQKGNYDLVYNQILATFKFLP